MEIIFPARKFKRRNMKKNMGRPGLQDKTLSSPAAADSL
jgi:hypothetical protein